MCGISEFWVVAGFDCEVSFFILCIFCVPCGFCSYKEGGIGVGGGEVPVLYMTRTWGVRCFFLGTHAATAKAPAFSEF